MKLLAISLLLAFPLQAGSDETDDSSSQTNQNISYLTTDRCTIGSTRVCKDFNSVYRMLVDPQVAKFCFGPELNAAEMATLDCLKNKLGLGVNMLACSLLPRKFGYRWTIKNKENNDFIGMVSLQFTDNFPGLPARGNYLKIGCELRPQYHYQGYAFEVGQALMNLLKNNRRFAVDTLVCRINAKNTAARMLVEKMGFTQVSEQTITQPPFGIGTAPYQACIYAKHLK